MFALRPLSTFCSACGFWAMWKVHMHKYVSRLGTEAVTDVSPRWIFQSVTRLWECGCVGWGWGRFTNRSLSPGASNLFDAVVWLSRVVGHVLLCKRLHLQHESRTLLPNCSSWWPGRRRVLWNSSVSHVPPACPWSRGLA